MANIRIHNVSGAPIGLPCPYRGLLGPGDSAVVSGTETEVIEKLGGHHFAGNILRFSPTEDPLTFHDGACGGLVETLRAFHEPIVTAAAGTNAPGQAPDMGVIQSTLVAEFTLNTDAAYRTFKIPTWYVDTPAFHVHWTKESTAGGDVDESTKEVRWRISYTIFPGEGADINAAPTVVDIDDVYDDSGTTTRIVHRTADVAAVGVVAGYYMGVCIEAVTPGGVAMASEPALVTLDFTYNGYLNQ